MTENFEAKGIKALAEMLKKMGQEVKELKEKIDKKDEKK